MDLFYRIKLKLSKQKHVVSNMDVFTLCLEKHRGLLSYAHFFTVCFLERAIFYFALSDKKALELKGNNPVILVIATGSDCISHPYILVQAFLDWKQIMQLLIHSLAKYETSACSVTCQSKVFHHFREIPYRTSH